MTVAGLIVSQALVFAGLYVVITQGGDMAVFGWLLVAVGGLSFAANMFLRQQGFRMPRRRRSGRRG
jgi:hypothetical protein